MRVLVVNKYWRPLGGVETHVMAVAAHLEAMGHQVIPFAMMEDETLETQVGEYFPSQVDFRVTSLKSGLRSVERSTVSSETRKKLRALLRERSVDAAYVVHVYHQLGTVVLNILEEFGIPTVLSIHDYKIACPNYRLFSERTQAICTRCLDHRTGFLWAPIVEGCWSGSRVAGAALALEATATRMRRSYQRPGAVITTNSLQDRCAVAAGVDPRNLFRIPHPVALKGDRSHPVRSEFLVIARLVPEKGVDIAVKAAALSGHPLVVVGDGRESENLRLLARELDAPVVFAGGLTLEETRSRLREARALVVPSVWHEVSPLVVYDAIAADVPVIGTDVGGMSDLLGDGRGYLVPPTSVSQLAQAMDSVANDQAAAQRVSQQARSFAAANWSPETWSARLSEAFEHAGAGPL